ncbi:MAG: ABC transporter permease [Anaerolineales bacterium]|nr:ABC transporter permease [Anaerolineales bacterium]
MLDIAIKNLGARKARSILCILAVLAGVFLVGTTITMNKWMYWMMTAELAKYMGKIYVQQGGSSYPPIDSSLNQETAEAILSRDDLGLNPAESAPLAFIRTERGMMPFIPAEVMVIGIPVGKETVLLGTLEAAEGVNRFDAGEPGEVAILGDKVSKKLGASVGQTVTVNGHSVRVIGVLETSSMGSVDVAVLMPLEVAQRIFAREGQISSVLLTPNDVQKTAEIAAILRRDYPSLQVATEDDLLAEAEKVMRMPIVYMSSMGVTGLIVAMIVIMSTMFMAVEERTREFGTLRALGARRRMIIGTVLFEALALALVGGVPALGLVFLMTRVMETTSPDIAQLSQIVVLAALSAILGGAFPAWRAARVEPLEALRYE